MKISHALIKTGQIILILVMLFTTQLFYIFQVLFFFLRFLIVSCLYRLSCVFDQALFFEAATFLHNPGWKHLKFRSNFLDEIGGGSYQNFVFRDFIVFISNQASRSEVLKQFQSRPLDQCFSNFFLPSLPFHSRHVVFAPQA